jgi:hypothetical protein
MKTGWLRLPIMLSGLLLGVLLGLLYGYLVQPLEYNSTTPAELDPTAQALYLELVAGAFAHDGDAQRAEQRLLALGWRNPAEQLTAYAQRLAAQKPNSVTIYNLGQLAFVLNGGASTFATFTPAVTTTPRPSPTLAPSYTPLPIYTSTPTATPIPATPSPQPLASPTAVQDTKPDFALQAQLQGCDMNRSGLLQVWVTDASGQDLPGVLFYLRNAASSQRFATGLQPENGLGYADARLQPNEIYSLEVGQRTPPLPSLQLPTCNTPNGTAYPGYLELRWQQARQP